MADEQIKYIHYGSAAFDPAQMKPIKNRERDSKPDGGLWACRTDQEYGWKELVRDEELLRQYYGIPYCTDDNAFVFTLAENAKILFIDTTELLLRQPLKKKRQYPEDNFEWVGLDFEELIKTGYDAVEVLFDSEIDWKLPHVMRGWDISSILVMNPDVVVPK